MNKRPLPSELSSSEDPASDGDLFRDAVGKVRPVPDDRTESRPAKPKPEPKQSQAAEDRVAEHLARTDPGTTTIATGEELSFLKPGLQSRMLRRLRRGQYAPEGELDLHNLNETSARRMLIDFLAQAHRHGVRCVKIIHGKGLRSDATGPVLKSVTNAFLRGRSDVLAFTSARANDGGTGAVYVLLSLDH